ncbi:hypothetical protein EDB87DRAFT_1256567 [Lactarius vividus]|nr:hypothetical protein EDB87DRAFT_1256567 [Lactarius vividus]
MPLKSCSVFPAPLTPSLHRLFRTLLVVMSEKHHVRSRHPSFRGNSVPFPRAPSISRQSLGLTPADFESIGYSYAQAYDHLSHDPNATHQMRISRSPAGSTRSFRARPGAQQLSPVVEESEERRRSRGSRSIASSPVTRRSSVPVPLVGEPIAGDIFPEDITIAIMSLLPQVEARSAAIARQRPRTPKIYMPVKRVAKAAGRAISGAVKVIPTICLKHRY